MLEDCKQIGRCVGFIGDATVGRQRLSPLSEVPLDSFDVLQLYSDIWCDVCLF